MTTRFMMTMTMMMVAIESQGWVECSVGLQWPARLPPMRCRRIVVEIKAELINAMFELLPLV